MKIIDFKRGIAAGVILFAFNIPVFAQGVLKRNTISLNGTWQIEEGKNDVIPQSFTHTIPVPGLVSLSIPEFKEVGPKVADRKSATQSDPLREAFWYKRTFKINGKIPSIAVLKIAKAMFGSKVFLNGKELGEHLPNFTPGYFNVKDALKEGENDLIVRVGASRSAVPLTIPSGFDFEKERYIPGIYDNVQLILSGTPNIINVQTVPDIIHNDVGVQLNIGTSGDVRSTALSFLIREVKSRKVVGVLNAQINLPHSSGDTSVYFKIPIKNCRLWSPEDPFLYSIEINTDADAVHTQFGMREFHFDPLTKKAVLNGKPYFMRGSNITLYRFFEDQASKSLPWNATWVRGLHKSFKKFHWNSLRYCIGLAPEDWYEIADEEGFLIQNEFPIWYGGTNWNTWPEELESKELVTEYTDWMKEDWNHASIVIWDGSNENVSNNGREDQTGKAIWQVRKLDLSNRPWDNSYSPNRAPGDVYESHPYHFINPHFKLTDIAKESIIPQGNQHRNHENFAVIINEYGWLWLNRDGTPTTLTRELYDNLLGANSTTAQRRHLYALYTAAETEFWRCHRQVAAVLHFTALGYSRSDGQTSDHFIDPAKLEYESEFVKYMPDAFSPVGIMLDEWGDEIEAGKSHNFKILTINDKEINWSGSVHIQILKGESVVFDKLAPLTISSYGQKELAISCDLPKEKGLFTVQAVLVKNGEKPVKSVREIVFK
ncbi:MAG: Beta-galactosidase [Mucilaginibacter sp.]|nr:Beta-galactosidase [Mucilaginibacter sp.]